MMNGNFNQGRGFLPDQVMMNRMSMMAMSPQIQMQQQHEQMAMAQAYQNMAAAYTKQKEMQQIHYDDSLMDERQMDGDIMRRDILMNERQMDGDIMRRDILMNERHMDSDMMRRDSLMDERQADSDMMRRDSLMDERQMDSDRMRRDDRAGDRDRERDYYRRGERRDDRDRDRDRDRDIRRRENRDRRETRDGDARDSERRDVRDYNRRETRDYDRRDRERSHDRRRSRSRDQDRSERDRGRDREQRDRDRYDDHGRGGDRDDGGSGRWISHTPSNTLILRNLAPILSETDILAEFTGAGMPVQEVRLMKHKITGASRGFAFVEFATTADAQHWMDTNQSAMTIQGMHYVPMTFSAPKISDAGRMVDPSGRSDWICCKCNAHNFKRRDFCFKCDVPREESERTVSAVMEDGSEHVGINPCNTLLLRGLDALTTEETITNLLTEITGMPVKNVIVIRDELTNTSKGYGFVELHSLADSQEVLGGVTKRSAPLDIDGKAIIVTYAKNTFSTTLQTLEAAAANAAKKPEPSQVRSSRDFKSSNGGPSTSSSSTSNSHQHRYRHIDAKERKLMTAAQNAHEQAQWSSQNDYSQSSSSTQQQQYPAPDVSTYQYDETSGYYYDASTGLYYDANTQYYWNQETQKFMYWDSNTSKYHVAPNQTEITAASHDAAASLQEQKQQQQPQPQSEEQQPQETFTTTAEGDLIPTKKDKEKKEKVKMAKKIAKDMEKWAKSMNKVKAKPGVSTLAQPQPVLSEPIYTEPVMGRLSTADAGYAMLSATGKNDISLMPPPSMARTTPDRASGSGTPGLVASYGGDSDDDDSNFVNDNDESAIDLEKLIDWNKMACLLCKRQFPKKDVLSKHIQLSDLHKKNVEELLAKHQNPTYRDRAKERRNKIGSTPPMGRYR